MTFATVAVFKEQDPGYILYTMYNYWIFGHILGFVFFFFWIYLMIMEDHVDVKVFLFVFNIFGYMFISLFCMYFMYSYN